MSTRSDCMCTKPVVRRWASFFSVLVSLLLVMPAVAQSNCCVPNGGVGCDDPACEAAVCAIDSFCCDVAWDGICASEALTECPKLCGVVGGCPTPSDNDCCVGNATPGCNNDACCEIVCAADPFCCDVAWDDICAGTAQDTPACNCVVGLPNDDCPDRIDIFNGSTEFSNVGATTDGPSPCGGLGSDIWYNYIAECTGSIIIDTLGSTFDTVLAAYDGCECPSAPASNCCVANGGLGCDNDKCEAAVCAADSFCCDVAWDSICAGEAADLCGDLCIGGGSPLLACNDDFPVCCTSQITIAVVQGNCYKLQVGGFQGDQGTGVITITKGPDCVASACPTPSGNDCCVSNGTPGCNNDACCERVCAIDSFCCDVAWDSICADEAATFPQCNCVSGCPPSGNDCCEPSPDGTPGCNNPDCCDRVCGIDPFCCDVAWDSICAGEAATFPQCNCVIGPVCGNGVCENGEDCKSCPEDCGPCPPVCGNGVCEKGEDCKSCPEDCGPCPLCPPSDNECCVASPEGTPGCNNPDCCERVCGIDPFCCDVAWDSICAGEAATFPQCNCVVDICPPSENDCCVASPDGSPGCNNDDCCERVCGIDPFCCDVTWDSICAGEAAKFDQCNCDGAVCPPNENDCCVASSDGTPGCNQPKCCESVCAADPFCCEVEWDSICADEAAANPNCDCVIDCNQNCPADLAPVGSGDDEVGPGDLGELLANWGDPENPCADIFPVGAPDGVVGPGDLGELLANWGLCPCRPDNPNDCCEASPDGTPGCNAKDCCVRVCEIEPSCCDREWDSLCAELAATFEQCNCDAGVCPPSENDCCVPSPDGTPGCNNDDCCERVCAIDSFCCDIAWDSICAGEAAKFDQCNCDKPGVCPPSTNECCEPSPDGSPGCNNVDCCERVCAIDPFCCETAWDSICAGEAATFPQCNCVIGPVCGNGVCEKGEDCKSCPEDCGPCPLCPPSNNECCEPSPDGTPGCNNPDCCERVCGIDPFCCDVAWDGICAGEAATFPQCNCVVGGCPTPSDNDCCVGNDTPGCNNDACCEIVCAADPFCCDVAWDDICAGAAAGIPECNCDAGVCPPSENDCCAASPDGTPGCNNDDCCERVCAIDSFCCDVAWDSICAGEAETFPQCNCGVVGVCDKANPNDCCVANATPGCNDVACCESVCAADPFCCDTAWDSICADEAAADPNCNCGVGGCPTPSGNDCCVANATPGCNNDACCAIVCGADPFCCDVAWDAICASAAAGFPECNCGVGGCPTPSGNDCCVSNGTPGCNNDACCACVCGLDPFCCDVAWDGICASEAANECAASCPCG